MTLCAGNAGLACRRIENNGNGTATTFTYDQLNRLTNISYSDSTPSAHYCYDKTSYNGLSISNGLGRRSWMTDKGDCVAVSTTNAAAWSYDADGRIVSEQRTIAGVTKTVSYAYNEDGTVKNITYPGGRIFYYGTSKAQRYTASWDSANDNFATAASYAASGAVNSIIYGQVTGGFNGITETRS